MIEHVGSTYHDAAAKSEATGFCVTGSGWNQNIQKLYNFLIMTVCLLQPVLQTEQRHESTIEYLEWSFYDNVKHSNLDVSIGSTSFKIFDGFCTVRT